MERAERVCQRRVQSSSRGLAMAMNEESLDLPVVADTPLEGAASIAAAVETDDPAEFQRRLAANDLRISSARGKLLDDAMRLLARLRGRREIADLGIHPARLDWLGFHVPPGGSGTLTLKESAEGKSSVQLKFMGFGGGSRRSITLSAERDFGAREQCFYLGVALDVRLRTFAEGGGEADTLQVDIEQMTGSYLRAEPVCPLCFHSAARKPARAKRMGRGWDLTADDRGVTETIKYDLSEAFELEIGLEIPLLDAPLKPAVEMSRTVKSTCSASYKFPGGARFDAYQLIGNRLDLPFWGKG
jgi:hypothetical protein